MLRSASKWTMPGVLSSKLTIVYIFSRKHKHFVPKQKHPLRTLEPNTKKFNFIHHPLTNEGKTFNVQKHSHMVTVSNQTVWRTMVKEVKPLVSAWRALMTNEPEREW